MKEIRHSCSFGCTVVWHSAADSATYTYDNAAELVQTILLRASGEELLDALKAHAYSSIYREDFVKQLNEFTEIVFTQHVATKLSVPVASVKQSK